MTKKRAFFSIFFLLVFLLLFGVISTLSLATNTNYPTEPPLIEAQNKYFWFPIELSAVIPYVITDVTIEDRKSNTASDDILFYIYDYSNQSILPGSGYASINKGFEVYKNRLEMPNASKMYVSSVAIFVLIPSDYVLQDPELVLTIEYMPLGIFSRSVSTTLM